jgi:hypothetical protein
MRNVVALKILINSNIFNRHCACKKHTACIICNGCNRANSSILYGDNIFAFMDVINKQQFLMQCLKYYISIALATLRQKTV